MLNAINDMLAVKFIMSSKYNTAAKIIEIKPAISQGLGLNLESSILLKFNVLINYLISAPFTTFSFGETKTNLPSLSSAIRIIPCD